MFWQKYLDDLGEAKIEFGLERITKVFFELSKKIKFYPKIITVGGTNGKGSTCAFLNSLLIAQGNRVGLFTSPHLFCFNERICVNNIPISDNELDLAIIEIESARNVVGVKLSYFEVSALIAWVYFAKSNCQILILEVGLGGRLDAINIWDCDIAVISTIDLDHTQYLGNTRELIALEKVAIARKNSPLICGDFSPPSTLINFCQNQKIKLSRINQNFGFKRLQNAWGFWFKDGDSNQIKMLENLPLPKLYGDIQLQNAAVAIYTVFSLYKKFNIDFANNKIGLAITNAYIKARFEEIKIAGKCSLIFDICHNPQAGKNLAQNLTDDFSRSNKNAETKPNYYAVFSALADKDTAEIIRPLSNIFKQWFVAGLPQSPRGQSATVISQIITPIIIPKNSFEDKTSTKLITICQNPISAIKKALSIAKKNDRIVIFGSFLTVAECYTFANLIKRDFNKI